MIVLRNTINLYEEVINGETVSISNNLVYVFSVLGWYNRVYMEVLKWLKETSVISIISIIW